MIKIDTNDKAVHFLYWLASIKRFDGLDIAREIEKPSIFKDLQKEFLNDKKEQ